MVSSQGSYELKIGSWMCKGLLDEKPTFVFHSIKQFCDAPSPIPFILHRTDGMSVCPASPVSLLDILTPDLMSQNLHFNKPPWNLCPLLYLVLFCFLLTCLSSLRLSLKVQAIK